MSSPYKESLCTHEKQWQELLTTSGQSLLEIVIAVGVGAILIMGALTLLSPVLKTSKVNNQNEVATGLSKELMDNVRVVAEANWNTIANLATSSANLYYLNTTSSPFTVSTGTQQIVISSTTYTRSFYTDDVYRDGNGYIVTTSTLLDPSTKKITVSYKAPQSSTQTISTYLTRSLSKVFRQTDWSGGGGQQGPASNANSQFATSSNIDSKIQPGSIRICFAFGSGGVVTEVPSSNGVSAIAKDATYMYVTEYGSSSEWIIEKRYLSDGSVDTNFGIGGMVSRATTSSYASDIRIDGTYMYVAGFDQNSNFSIEKRLLSDGSLVPGFGTSGVVTGGYIKQDGGYFAIDSTSLYIIGEGQPDQWRIEKYFLSNGAPDTNFGSSGVVVDDAFTDDVYAIAIDSTYMYLGGDNDALDWRIEKRLLSDGSLVHGFGSSGVVTGTSSSRLVDSIAIDATYMYVNGNDDNNDWRIEKRLLSDGSLVTNFGSSGVVTGDPLSNTPSGSVIDSTWMYVVGRDDTPDGRIEKHLLSNGSLSC
jgi:type II secretory pathway pseudopilin PulG